MKSSQYPAVLFSSVGLCLVVSLFTLARSTERIRGYCSTIEARHVRDSLTLDTLAAVNSFLVTGLDSLQMYRHQNDSLRTRLTEADLAQTYPGYYLIIDATQNRFHLRRGNILVRSGFVGTGKGWTESSAGHSWDFSTPRGIRHVLYKTRNPYWYRPDWYWQEQSLRPPAHGQEVTIPEGLSWEEQISYFNDSLTSSERVWVRVVPGALGSYALDLGSGILLHYGVGRGRNVSHGCIRLASDDLEAIFRTLEIGSPVLIY
ncbi:MAG: L,D-transpeptidase [Candidatus Fermentibacteraceae bacterium]